MKKFITSWLLLLFVVFLVACGEDTPEAEVYTLTFNVNGGTAVTAVQVEEGMTTTAPTQPTKTCYVFKGWYSDAAFTTPLILLIS